MELEKQVTSLEWSRRLQKLGVKQESLFDWQYGDGIMAPTPIVCVHQGDDWDEDFYHVSAYTVAELGEILKNGHPNFRQWYSYPDWRLAREDQSTSDARNENEANARAAMVAYLKENGFI